MTRQRLDRLAAVLANQGFVRTYAHTYPGEYAIEILTQQGEDIALLRAELEGEGGQLVFTTAIGDRPVYQFRFPCDESEGTPL